LQKECNFFSFFSKGHKIDKNMSIEKQTEQSSRYTKAEHEIKVLCPVINRMLRLF
jgi:hypothetical protein